MQKNPHARYLRGGRQSEAMTTYAVTKCVENRRPVLASKHAASIILDCIDYMRSDDRMRQLAFCIMPDHVHLLLVLLDKCSLHDLVRDFCRFTARRLNALESRRGEFWQDNFHDHRCRDEADAIERLTYIEHNPVRAGLVKVAAEWPFSSACPDNALRLDREWYASVR